MTTINTRLSEKAWQAAYDAASDVLKLVKRIDLSKRYAVQFCLAVSDSRYTEFCSEHCISDNNIKRTMQKAAEAAVDDWATIQ